jgi:hypothetical protein
MMPYHRIHKFYSIVFWRIVTGSDHKTNSLSIELPRTQRGEETDAKDDGIEEMAVRRGMLAITIILKERSESTISCGTVENVISLKLQRVELYIRLQCHIGRCGLALDA